MPTDSQGTRSRSGGMSVSLASPDGRVVGGGVAGLLIAASPVQVSIALSHSFGVKRKGLGFYLGSRNDTCVHDSRACFSLFAVCLGVRLNFVSVHINRR